MNSRNLNSVLGRILKLLYRTILKMIPKKFRTDLGIILLLILFGGFWFLQHQGWLQSTNSETIKSPPSGYYRVLKVDDGDTVIVEMNGQPQTVRFIGVDTPEIHDPRKVVQCFGRAASQFTKTLIGDNFVRLEADPLSSNYDRYNRLLRYLFLPDGRLVNIEIITSGYGFAYTSFPFTKSSEFSTAQKAARQQNLGLWKSCSPQQNQYGGYTSNPQN